ncbi:MAG: ParB/RepB/Spo0J family partition protein [Actinomycetes bacterium]
MAKRQGLGKGLDALMPSVPRETSRGAKPAAKKSASKPAAKAPQKPPARTSPPQKIAAGVAKAAAPSPMEVAGLTLVELPVKSISPNPNQPRTVFDEESLAELVFSIQEVGLLQPVVVRKSKTGYELVAGERRLRASKKAGLKTIPALVRDTADDAMLRDALLENLHRSQLTALEEASAYQQLLSDFGCTQEQLATRLGRSRPQITNTIRLLNLPPAVQRRVAAGVLSAGHARALLGLKQAADIEKLASRIVAEGLSVRTVEEIVSLGDGGKTKSKKPATKGAGTISAPGLKDLGNRMSERLDTRVTVQLGRSKGKVVIEFATLEDLRRIVEIVDPPKRDVFGDRLK